MFKGRKNYWWWFLIPVAILLVVIGIFFLVKSKADSESLETLTIQPTQKHTSTVIFLHGLGGNATSQKAEIEPIAKNHPHTKFIFPQAPIISISMNSGWPMPGWYDIRGNRNDIANLKQDKKGLLKSVKQIEKIIREEINIGIPPQKIMVMGHSQGGSVALAVGLLTEYKLVGIVCLGGFLPCREEVFNWTEEKNQQIPFWLYHNYYDNMVPAWVGDESAKLLKQKGYQVEFDNSYNGTGADNHLFRSDELAKIISEALTHLI